MKRQTRGGGFTMLELLVVIAVIVAMAGLLFPAIINTIKKAEMALAHSEVMAFDSAMRAYLLEYGHFPNQTTLGTQLTPYHNYGYKDTNVLLQTGDSRDYLHLVSTLLGQSTRFEDNPGVDPNPKRKVFLQLPNRFNGGATNRNSGVGNNTAMQGEFTDPWGGRYQIMASWRLDNTVKGTSYGNVVGRNVAVWNSTKGRISSW